MNIRILGSGAADGIPGLFSNNSVSKYARQHGGKDVRSRAAALVDGVFKLDLGPDTLMQMQRERLDGRDWTALAFTHSHEDHFAVSEIQYALFPFVEQDYAPFTIFANGTVTREIRARYPHWPLEIVETRSFLTYTHGPYRITPVAANHTIGEDCHNLLLERQGKTLFYATDTGVWSPETTAFLSHFSIDLMVLECTEGFERTDYHGHLDVTEAIQMVDMLRAQGSLTSTSRVITTHHAHTGNAKHCDLEKAFEPHGIEPGFDGMFAEF